MQIQGRGLQSPRKMPKRVEIATVGDWVVPGRK